MWRLDADHVVARATCEPNGHVPLANPLRRSNAVCSLARLKRQDRDRCVLGEPFQFQTQRCSRRERVRLVGQRSGDVRETNLQRAMGGVSEDERAGVGRGQGRQREPALGVAAGGQVAPDVGGVRRGLAREGVVARRIGERSIGEVEIFARRLAAKARDRQTNAGHRLAVIIAEMQRERRRPRETDRERVDLRQLRTLHEVGLVERDPARGVASGRGGDFADPVASRGERPPPVGIARGCRRLQSKRRRAIAEVPHDARSRDRPSGLIDDDPLQRRGFGPAHGEGRDHHRNQRNRASLQHRDPFSLTFVVLIVVLSGAAVPPTFRNGRHSESLRRPLPRC